MSQSANETKKACPRVLMVDDDQALLDALADWLQTRCGAVVTALASAEEVMTSTQPGSFDVCILDYRLTGANGLTLGAMLREINPDARLILISGGITSTIESLALEHGFDQGPPARALLVELGYEGVVTRADLEGRERVTAGRRPTTRRD